MCETAKRNRFLKRIRDDAGVVRVAEANREHHIPVCPVRYDEVMEYNLAEELNAVLRHTGDILYVVSAAGEDDSLRYEVTEDDFLGPACRSWSGDCVCQAVYEDAVDKPSDSFQTAARHAERHRHAFRLRVHMADVLKSVLQLQGHHVNCNGARGGCLGGHADNADGDDVATRLQIAVHIKVELAAVGEVSGYRLYTLSAVTAECDCTRRIVTGTLAALTVYDVIGCADIVACGAFLHIT